MLTNRRTDTKSSTFVSPDPLYSAWEPQWFYGGRGRWGYRSYSPFWGPGYGGYDVDQITRFKANAEILMGHGKKPADNPAAFDARDVQANLAPTIAKPVAKT
jgi:hypothetical protein